MTPQAIGSALFGLRRISDSKEVQEIVTQRLMGMKDKELKELDKDGLPSVLASFRAFLQIAKSDAVKRATSKT